MTDAGAPRSPFDKSPPAHIPVTDAERLFAPATLAITAGRPHAGGDVPLNEPVTFASAYHAGGPVAYARDGLAWQCFNACSP